MAPGTVGSLLGFGAFWLLQGLPLAVELALLGAAILVGTWASGRYARDRGEPDPPSAVVDEFCGMWLAVAGAAPGLGWGVAAFVGFRLLDILKPPPIRSAERLPGGVGIMLDDLAAAVFVRVALYLVLGG